MCFTHYLNIHYVLKKLKIKKKKDVRVFDHVGILNKR